MVRKLFLDSKSGEEERFTRRIEKNKRNGVDDEFRSMDENVHIYNM